MKIVTRWAGDSLRDVPASASRAESSGFDGWMAMENAHEPYLPIALAAEHSTRLELSTGIAISFPRSPMVTANAAFDLQEASRGRFVLGLGPQVKGHNERRFSVPWSAPAPRMREYIESLRAIWRCWEVGEALDYRGQFYQFTLMTPNFSPPPTGLPMVPVTLAAVGRGMIRLAGSLCDGVALHPFCTRRYLDHVVVPELEAAMASSDMKRSQFLVSGGGFIATAPDEDTVRRIAEFVRYRVAFYASTRTYWPVLAEHDLEDVGAELHELSKRGAWDRMAALISDDVLELFAVVGTHSEIVPRIAERFSGVVDQVMAMPAPDADPALTPDLVQEIQAIPARFEQWKSRW